jgi:uncharacterized protein (DUF427 family)
MDVVKVPGPDHPITIAPLSGRVRALYQGHEIADSQDAVVLMEASYAPVVYFPREDVEMEVLARTELDTYCPYKGHASYFTIRRDGTIAENAVWSYETPHPGMAAIAERVAFYPNVVTIEGLTDPDAVSVSPDATVLHTDAGAGAPQRAPWPASVDAPDDRL